jgi:anti-sigma factor RsiW
MTDCPNGDIRDLLPDLLNGTLAPDQRAGVEAHLLTCDDCREEMELLRGMRRSMHRVSAPPAADIVRALPAYRAQVRRVGNGWRIAAALALLAGGGTSVVVARHADVLHGNRGPAGATAAGQTAVIAPTDTHVAQEATPTPAPHAVEAIGAPTAPRELAVASASVGDLSDEELDALVNEIGTLDAVTPPDVEQPGPVSPLPPSTTSGTGA